MRDVKKTLEYRYLGWSQRNTEKVVSISRNSIGKIWKAQDEKEIQWENICNLGEGEIVKLLFGEEEIETEIVKPDFDYVHKELLKPGTTLKLLWEEYADGCRKSRKPFYHYSYFAELYQDHVKKNNLTMHINHKPGDKIMVDWNGTTMEVHDRYTGEIQTAYLFEATLPFSMFCYVQACPTMKIPDWIDCHIKMYRYFGGVSRLLVPDNLKAGVISNKKYEDPILNKTYQEMADHYGTTIIPARVKAPKDKAAVEGSVHTCTMAINGKLRNNIFFSFDELNSAIQKQLDIFNKKQFEKREGSRESVFLEEEKPFLKTLPLFDFELSSWKQCKVQLNYHISVEKQNYSVPYEYVGKYVDVKITKRTVTVFYKSLQICSHARLYGRQNQYSTDVSHMPKNHQLFEWNKERYISWSLKIGPYTNQVVEKIFDRYAVEEQAYKGCLSLLKLKDKYSQARLENACKLALDHITQPGYKNIKKILESGQDLKENDMSYELSDDNSFAIVRGGSYYGGKNNE